MAMPKITTYAKLAGLWHDSFMVLNLLAMEYTQPAISREGKKEFY